MYSGHTLPNLWEWVVKEIQLSHEHTKPAQSDMEVDPPQNVNHEFLKELEAEKCFGRRSFDKWERIMHSHGASLREVFALRFGRFDRYVDVVVYPSSSEHVEKIV